MRKQRFPYDPDPSQEDAFAELANQGYDAVGQNHKSRLLGIQQKLKLPSEPTKNSTVVPLNRKVLAIAASIALLVVAGTVFWTYTNKQQSQVAQNLEHHTAEPATEDLSSLDQTKDIPNAATIEVSTIKDISKKSNTKSQSPNQGQASAQVYDRNQGNEIAESSQEEVSLLEELEYTSDIETEEVITLTEEQADIQIAQAEEQSNMLKSSRMAPASKDKRQSTPYPAKAFDLAPTSAELPSKSLDLMALAQNYTSEALLIYDPSGEQVNLGGLSSLELDRSQAVANIQVIDLPPIWFDLSTADAFVLAVNEENQSLSIRSPEGYSIPLLAPNANDYRAFDEYINQQKSDINDSQVFVVQFYINEAGQIEQIRPWPGSNEPKNLRLFRKWSKGAPLWPIAYRAKYWHYRVDIKE